MDKQNEPNDFNVYDMAMELAEREFVSLTITELLELARGSLEDQWVNVAEKYPSRVYQQYKDMVGVED